MTILKRTTKILGTIAGILLLLVLTLLLLSQTSFVRGLVMSELKSVLASSTNATLTASELQGNLITGFVLKDVRLQLHTGTAYDSVDILRADQLLARYSIFRYFRKDHRWKKIESLKGEDLFYC